MSQLICDLNSIMVFVYTKQFIQSIYIEYNRIMINKIVIKIDKLWKDQNHLNGHNTLYIASYQQK